MRKKNQTHQPLSFFNTFVHGNRKNYLVYCGFFFQSDRLAAGLTNLGIQRGDRVGIWAPNIPQWIIAQYATARAGIILVRTPGTYIVFKINFDQEGIKNKDLLCLILFETSF